MEQSLARLPRCTGRKRARTGAMKAAISLLLMISHHLLSTDALKLSSISDDRGHLGLSLLQAIETVRYRYEKAWTLVSAPEPTARDLEAALDLLQANAKHWESLEPVMRRWTGYGSRTTGTKQQSTKQADSVEALENENDRGLGDVEENDSVGSGMGEAMGTSSHGTSHIYDEAASLLAHNSAVLGQALSRSGHVDRGIKELEAACPEILEYQWNAQGARDSNSWIYCYTNLAEMYKAQERFEEAASLLEKMPLLHKDVTSSDYAQPGGGGVQKTPSSWPGDTKDPEGVTSGVEHDTEDAGPVKSGDRGGTGRDSVAPSGGSTKSELEKAEVEVEGDVNGDGSRTRKESSVKQEVLLEAVAEANTATTAAFGSHPRSLVELHAEGMRLRMNEIVGELAVTAATRPPATQEWLDSKVAAAAEVLATVREGILVQENPVKLDETVMTGPLPTGHPGRSSILMEASHYLSAMKGIAAKGWSYVDDELTRMEQHPPSPAKKGFQSRREVIHTFRYLLMKATQYAAEDHSPSSSLYGSSTGGRRTRKKDGSSTTTNKSRRDDSSRRGTRDEGSSRGHKGAPNETSIYGGILSLVAALAAGACAVAAILGGGNGGRNRRRSVVRQRIATRAARNAGSYVEPVHRSSAVNLLNQAWENMKRSGRLLSAQALVRGSQIHLYCVELSGRMVSCVLHCAPGCSRVRDSTSKKGALARTKGHKQRKQARKLSVVPPALSTTPPTGPAAAAPVAGLSEVSNIAASESLSRGVTPAKEPVTAPSVSLVTLRETVSSTVVSTGSLYVDVPGNNRHQEPSRNGCATNVSCDDSTVPLQDGEAYKSTETDGMGRQGREMSDATLAAAAAAAAVAFTSSPLMPVGAISYIDGVTEEQVRAMMEEDEKAWEQVQWTEEDTSEVCQRFSNTGERGAVGSMWCGRGGGEEEWSEVGAGGSRRKGGGGVSSGRGSNVGNGNHTKSNSIVSRGRLSLKNVRAAAARAAASDASNSTGTPTASSGSDCSDRSKENCCPSRLGIIGGTSKALKTRAELHAKVNANARRNGRKPAVPGMSTVSGRYTLRSPDSQANAPSSSVSCTGRAYQSCVRQGQQIAQRTSTRGRGSFVRSTSDKSPRVVKGATGKVPSLKAQSRGSSRSGDVAGPRQANPLIVHRGHSASSQPSSAAGNTGIGTKVWGDQLQKPATPCEAIALTQSTSTVSISPVWPGDVGSGEANKIVHQPDAWASQENQNQHWEFKQHTTAQSQPPQQPMGYSHGAFPEMSSTAPLRQEPQQQLAMPVLPPPPPQQQMHHQQSGCLQAPTPEESNDAVINAPQVQVQGMMPMGPGVIGPASVCPTTYLGQQQNTMPPAPAQVSLPRMPLLETCMSSSLGEGMVPDAMLGTAPPLSLHQQQHPLVLQNSSSCSSNGSGHGTHSPSYAEVYSYGGEVDVVPPVVCIHPQDGMESLLGTLCWQVEYYFSPANLVGDTYLRNLMDEEGFVELSKIMMFNRVRIMTSDVAVLAEALRRSTKLDLREPGLSRDFLVRTMDCPLQWVVCTKATCHIADVGENLTTEGEGNGHK